MPKAAKKTSTKKAPAKTAKKQAAKAKNEKKTSPKKAQPAKPARLVSRKRDGGGDVTMEIGSVTMEDVAVRAYFIGERRRSLGLPGNPESDWLEAEGQLRV